MIDMITRTKYCFYFVVYESINEHVDYKQKGYQDLCQLSGHKLPHTSTVCGNGNGKGNESTAEKIRLNLLLCPMQGRVMTVH